MRLWRYILFLVFGSLYVYAAYAAHAGAQAAEWTLYRFEGRDYVSLDNLEAFYGFPIQVTPAGNRITVDSGKAQLELILNSREIVINGVTQWLAFPVLIRRRARFISRLDLAKTIEPLLRPWMIQQFQAVRNVVLDPGHGGYDKGALSSQGCEKDFALDVCRRARARLEAEGFRVFLTRDSDVFVPLEERPRAANRMPNSVFVSVHFNCSVENPSASGFEVFALTPRGAPSTTDDVLSLRDLRSEPGNVVDTQSMALAASVYHSMLGSIPEADRGIKRARFAVIRLATVPSILVEGGFLTNPSDSMLIANPEWREKLAAAIVTGLDGFKRLAENKEPPKLLADYRRELPSSVTLRDSGAVLTNAKAAPQVIIPRTIWMTQPFLSR